MTALPSTTPTGIPITLCDQCGFRHPITREHCPTCGSARLFGHDNCHTKDQP